MKDNLRRESASDVSNNEMTIGDLIDAPLTQELYEVRLEVGEKARGIYRREKQRERQLISHREKLKEKLYSLDKGLDRLLNREKLPGNHKAVKRIKRAIRDERIRLKANSEYQGVLEELRACRRRIDRAVADIRHAPTERGR